MTAASPTTKPTSSSKTFLPSLTAGIALGFTEVVFSISIASLIFSGPLKSALPRGVAIALVTTVVHVLLTTLVSSLPEFISGLEDGSSVLLAVGAASLAGMLGVSANLLPTVIGFMVAATVLTSLFLLLLGSFKLGELVRYIPYPVIGGFMAGSGWLLLRGSIGSMADYPLDVAAIPKLLSADQLPLWLPGVVFGLALFVGVRRLKHYFTVPGILLIGLVLFYAVLLLSGMSIETAMQRGLLLGQIGGVDWQPLPVGDLAKADWGAVLGQAGTIGAILMIAGVEMLLNISSLELELRQDLDLNRELRTAGIGNILSVLAGGTVGFQSLTSTMMNHRMGARGRLASLITGVICFMVLLGGAPILAYVPKPLLGGLLFFLGLEFLDQWLVEGRKRLGHTDYGVVLLILVIIAAWGFLIGVTVGLVVMVVLFVVNYSRLDLFHRATSGAEVASHVDRNAYNRRALAKLTEQIYVLELQGFVFFGTANTILEAVRQRLTAPNQPPLAYLILDFHRVTALDSSAAFSLTKVKYLAEVHQFVVVFTHLKDETRREWMRNELAEGEYIKVFEDLDHGMEWCEDMLLKRDKVTRKHVPATLEFQLAENGFRREYTQRLIPYLEQRLLNEGDYLIRHGESAGDLFFVEIGRVSVYLELGDGKRMRVRTMSKGSVVGELGFYLNVERSASVIADAQSLVYRLTQPAMAEMKAKDMELAMAFNELMLRLVSERLIATNHDVAVLNL